MNGQGRLIFDPMKYRRLRLERELKEDTKKGGKLFMTGIDWDATFSLAAAAASPFSLLLPHCTTVLHTTTDKWLLKNVHVYTAGRAPNQTV